MNTLLTAKKVADLLDCRPSSVYAWAKTGKIPALKINGLLRFDEVEIEAWIEKSKAIGNKPAKELSKFPQNKGSLDVDRAIKNAVDEANDHKV